MPWEMVVHRASGDTKALKSMVPTWLEGPLWEGHKMNHFQGWLHAIAILYAALRQIHLRSKDQSSLTDRDAYPKEVRSAHCLLG
jgi:hypothetical protein